MSIATKAATATLALQGQSRIEASAPPPSSRDSVLASSPAVRRTAEVRFDAGPGPDNRPGSLASPQMKPSEDSRYVRFVEAVQALRINVDQTTLPPAQIERMMESAREIFKLDDGIPRPVRPPEPAPPSPPPDGTDTDRSARPEAEASDRAARAQHEPDASADWQPVKAPPAPTGAADGAATGAITEAGDAEQADPDAAWTPDPASPAPTTKATAPPLAVQTGDAER